MAKKKERPAQAAPKIEGLMVQKSDTAMTIALVIEQRQRCLDLVAQRATNLDTKLVIFRGVCKRVESLASAIQRCRMYGSGSAEEKLKLWEEAKRLYDAYTPMALFVLEQDDKVPR